MASDDSGGASTTEEGGFGQEFRAGLLTPSVSALAAASLVCIVLFAASARLVGPWVVDPDHVRWFAATERDDAAFVASILTTLPDTPRDRPHVALLGASSMREAITSGADVERRLEAAIGRDLRVLELMTDNQAIEQSGALAALVPDDVPTVVVIGVTLYGLGRDPELARFLAVRPRFGAELNELDAELELQGVPPRRLRGIPLLDDPGFYLRRLPSVPANLVSGGSVWERHRFRHKRPIEIEELPTYADELIAWDDVIDGLTRHGDFRVEVVQRIVERIQTRGHVPVIAAGPRLRGWPHDPRADEAIEHYEALLDRIRQLPGVHVWLLDEAGLVRNDFVDVMHLRTANGTERYTAALIERLVPVVRDLR